MASQGCHITVIIQKSTDQQTNLNMEENITSETTPKNGTPSEEVILGSGKAYSEKKFWQKLLSAAKKAGIKVVYGALLLFYVLKSNGTPKGDRLKIIGALGYLILPIDIIPDWIPVVGFTDDLAAIVWALYSVAKNITPEIRQQAKDKLHDYFGDYDQDDIKVFD